MWAIPISLPSTLQLISSVTVKFLVDSSIAKDVAPAAAGKHYLHLVSDRFTLSCSLQSGKSAQAWKKPCMKRNFAKSVAILLFFH